MYYSLTALAAVLIAVMVAVNGALGAAFGLHLSVVVIHAVGFLFTSAVALVRRAHPLRVRGIPAVLFTGGAIGYFTTLFNNMAVGKISLTALLALSLLGQAATSLVIDQFGFFGMPVRKFSAARLAGLTATAAGIAVLLWGDTASAFVPAFVSLLTGVTVVTSRQVNAQLAARAGENGVTVSTWYNYLAGLLCSGAALGIAALSGASVAAPALASAGRAWIYTGGALGAAVVFISNLCVPRMPSLIMTLVMFAGQVFGGVAIDALTAGTFSWRTLAGGVFAFLGLLLNTLLEARTVKKRAGKP